MSPAAPPSTPAEPDHAAPQSWDELTASRLRWLCVFSLVSSSVYLLRFILTGGLYSALSECVVILGMGAVLLLLRVARERARLLAHVATALTLFGLWSLAMLSTERQGFAWYTVIAPFFVAWLLDARAALAWSVPTLGGMVLLSVGPAPAWLRPELTLRSSDITAAQVLLGIMMTFMAVGTRRAFDLHVRRRDDYSRVNAQQNALLKEQARELTVARDAALEAARAKSEFLATMSHELRTPLNAVLGLSSVLASTELDAEQRGFVSTIRTSGDALLSVLSDILDFSKIEAHRLVLEALEFSPLELLEEALEVVSSQAALKGLELTHESAPGVPALVVADRTRLRQVLLNLLGNAVKFTAQGHVHVRVDTQPSEAGACVLRFRVQDSGIGIPAERQGALFQPFTQVDASNTREFGGTGLGLAISRALVEAMGGALTVESAVGSGSEFAFTVRTATLSPERAASAALPLAPEPLRRGTVLVCDRHPRSAAMALCVLRRAGCESQLKDSPEALFAALREARPTLVLADLRTVGELLPELRALVAPTDVAPAVPLVLLEAPPGDGRPAHARPLRGESTLAMPLRLLVLLEALREAPSPGAGGRALPDAGRSLRVLLAEDNPVNQRVAQAMLQRLGHTVTVVDNGRKAVDAVRGGDFELVLMDVQMPEMDGLSATEELVRTVPRERRPRIIAMTANAMAGDRERCLAAGMDDYLAKPVQLKDLADLLAGRPSVEVLTHDSTALGAVDRQILVQLQQMGEQNGNPRLLADLIALLLETAPERLEQLVTASKRGDWGAVAVAAHVLKASCGTLGASRMMLLCAKLEGEARGGEVSPGLVERLEAAWRGTAHLLKLELERSEASEGAAS